MPETSATFAVDSEGTVEPIAPVLGEVPDDGDVDEVSDDDIAEAEAELRKGEALEAEVLEDEAPPVPVAGRPQAHIVRPAPAEPVAVTPGRIVLYQTDGRNGLDYALPAVVTVTAASHPGEYPAGKPNSLPVPADGCVHLTVFTPGGFGSTYVADGVESGYSATPQDEVPNLGRPDAFTPGSGAYVEWDVPFDADGGARSWRWPGRA